MMEKLLSAIEIDEIIKNFIGADKVVIHKYEIFPITDEHLGFCAEYCRLIVVFDDTCGNQTSKTFFVKTLPILSQKKRQMMEDYGIFQKEARIYKNLIPKLKKYSGDFKWCPECYYTREDIVVLEDLRDFNYKNILFDEEFEVSHFKKALRSLAVFHKSSILYENLELKPNGTNIGERHKDMLYETTILPGNGWTESGLRCLNTIALQKTKYGQDPKFKSLIESKLLQNLRGIFEIIKSQESKIPKTWIHRDIWKNNLMFSFDDDQTNPSHCVILDFAIGRYLPLTIDVLLMIVLSSRRHHRVQYFEHYVEFYYQTLKDELKKHDFQLDTLFSWKNFREDIDNFLIVALTMNSMYTTVTGLPSEFLAHLCDHDELEYKRVMIDNRDPEVLAHMDKDQTYRDILVESVEELIEYFFNVKNLMM